MRDNDGWVAMRDGRVLERTYKYPPGHPRNRMGDADIERKFMELSDGVLNASRAQQAIDQLWKFEHCADLGDLMNSLKADG